MNSQDTIIDRVADAPADIWVYRLLPRALWPYAQLARWDRPIGWWLLLWPCWISLALSFSVSTRNTLVDASSLAGFLAMLALFWLGAVTMRGAGCTYNDIVDVGIDAKVSRTASRPIPSGRVTRVQARSFFVFQVAVGGVVLISLCLFSTNFNLFAFGLAIASLIIVACYPFAKRVTDWPQLVLGLAFSWGALMGWAVIFSSLSLTAALLYVGSIFWVIGYDTIYAHQDREDDALVGVRSTARLFGKKTKLALSLLYTGTVVLFAAAYVTAGAGIAAYLGIIAGCIHMIWQIRTLDIDDADKCLALFKSNSHFGWIIFAGLLADLALRS